MIERRDVLRLGALLGLGGSGSLFPGFDRPAFAAEKLPVQIVNTAGDTTLIEQELMRQQGYLEQFGLDAQMLNVGDGSKLMGALLNGTEDISVISGFSQVFPAIVRGAKMKIIAGSELLVELCVYAKKPEIKSLKDLQGKTVATGSLGALLHQLMLALFQKHGIDPSTVTFVNVGGASDSFRAVTAGTVDAGPGPLAVYNQQDKYGVHSLSDGNMWSEIPEYTYQGAYVTDEAIAAKRDVLVRTLAAFAKLYRFMQSPESKDAFVTAREAILKTLDPVALREQAADHWEFCQKYRPFAVDLVLSEERIDYMQRLNIAVGLQQEILPYAQVTDMTLARDALKLIN